VFSSSDNYSNSYRVSSDAPDNTIKLPITKEFWMEFWMNIDPVFDNSKIKQYYFFMNPGIVLYQLKSTKLFYIGFLNDLVGEQQCTTGFSISKFSWHHIAVKASLTDDISVYLDFYPTKIAGSGTYCYINSTNSAANYPLIGNIFFRQSVPKFSNGGLSYTLVNIDWGSALYKNIKIWDNSANLTKCRKSTNLNSGIYTLSLDDIKYNNYIDSYYNENTLPCRLIMWFPLNESTNLSPNYAYNLAQNLVTMSQLIITQSDNDYESKYNYYTICAPDSYGNPTFFNEQKFLANPFDAYCDPCSNNSVYSSNSCIECANPATQCTKCVATGKYNSYNFALDFSQASCQTTYSYNRILILMIPLLSNDYNSAALTQTPISLLKKGDNSYIPFSFASGSTYLPFSVFFFYKFTGHLTYSFNGSTLNADRYPIMYIYDENGSGEYLNNDSHYEIGFDMSKNQFYACVCFATTNCCKNYSIYYDSTVFTIGSPVWVKIQFGVKTDEAFFCVDKNKLNNATLLPVKKIANRGSTTGVSNIKKFAFANYFYGMFGNVYFYNLYNYNVMTTSLSYNYKINSIGVFIPDLVAEFPYTLNPPQNPTSMFTALQPVSDPPMVSPMIIHENAKDSNGDIYITHTCQASSIINNSSPAYTCTQYTYFDLTTGTCKCKYNS
jgi:hypothetical protein